MKILLLVYICVSEYRKIFLESFSISEENNDTIKTLILEKSARECMTLFPVFCCMCKNMIIPRFGDTCWWAETKEEKIFHWWKFVIMTR